jgi:hypothetical protein
MSVYRYIEATVIAPISAPCVFQFSGFEIM